MPMHSSFQRSANYGYYADLLWCCVPLMAMAWFYYGPRPLLLMLAGLFTGAAAQALVGRMDRLQRRP